MTHPFVAYHVGRRGNIAGGMTQVINSYFSWDFRDFDVRFIASRGAPTALSSASMFLTAGWHLLSIRSRRSAVVVLHLSQRGSFVREGFLLLLARCTGLGVVAQLHGSQFPSYAAHRPRLVKCVLGAAHRVLVLSEESHDAVRSLGLRVPIDLLPNAVADGDPLQQKDSVVVFGGAVTRRKGVDVLLSAWSLARKPAEWRLVVAGPLSEPDLGEDVPAGVEIYGAVDHPRLMALLDRSAVAVLPSRDEAMPMFVLEAMARRNCVISTEVGGIAAVLDGGAGILLPPGDVDALTDALERVLGDEAVRDAFASLGLSKHKELFAMSVVFPRVEQIWRQVIGRTPGSVR